MLSADPTPLPTPVFGMCSGGMRPTPMLGLRGVRLLTVIPELVDAQVRGLCEAVADLHEEGLDPRAEILVPLVADARELTAARHRIEAAVAEVASARHSDVRLPVGVMIELPRAAVTAGALARSAEFFSFGTNDLTQTTWGISRDDAESSFLAEYRRAGLVPDDPFVVLDQVGVGQLVRWPSSRDGGCGRASASERAASTPATPGPSTTRHSRPGLRLQLPTASPHGPARGRARGSPDATITTLTELLGVRRRASTLRPHGGRSERGSKVPGRCR
jgi:hypothetical protein